MTYPTITRTRKETRLCYYTAWQQTQPRDYTKPTKREIAQVKEAVIMITLLASLNLIIYDLIDEMEAIGKYRHANKRNINRAKDIMMRAHDTIFRRIRSLNEQGSRDYNDAMDAFYSAIEECIGLRGDAEKHERAYNIIVAIVRLQAECRKRIDMRYFYQPSQDLEKIPSLLECLGIRDYRLDNIIERQVRSIKFRVNNEREEN